MSVYLSQFLISPYVPVTRRKIPQLVFAIKLILKFLFYVSVAVAANFDSES